jgi:hypothetical protein
VRHARPPLLVHCAAGDAATAKACAAAVQARRGTLASNAGSVCAVTLHQPTLPCLLGPAGGIPALGAMGATGPIAAPVVSASAKGAAEANAALGAATPVAGAASAVHVVCVAAVQDEALAYVRMLLTSGRPPAAVQKELDDATAQVLSARPPPHHPA